MSDRIAAFTVTLERDIREDDIEPILNAIRMVKGVCDVRAHESDIPLHVASVRVKREVIQKLEKMIEEFCK